MTPEEKLSFFETVGKEQEKCLERISKIKPIFGDNLFCNGTAGRMGACWNHTLAGETAVQSRILAINSYRISYYCTENGTWDIKGENYTHLNEISLESQGYVYVYIAGNALSLLLLTIALSIFFGFRQLRCGRVLIHKNLFLSYVFTGLTWILYYKLVVLDADIIDANPWWCQFLHVLAQYFMQCNFAWMFCEGLYLHTVLIRVFSNGKILTFICYAIGWGYPLIPTIIYTVLRSRTDKRCWHAESSLQWIMYGPIVVSICINIMFLVNIVRLLMTKLQKIPEASQSKKAARATLVLLPLLGLQYLVLPMRPSESSGLSDIYVYSVAVLTSLQGSFVSIMYCFCNSEIIAILKRKWDQHWLMYGSGRRKHRCSSTHYTVTENMADDCNKKFTDKPEMVPLQDTVCDV
ncbi:calcitonin receptor-like [Mytilus trossulus]|uniref:calcitonin receptor-like n=1 Tax=Mytilus trossulus TaxID=6551 RepID=UPI003005C2E9